MFIPRIIQYSYQYKESVILSLLSDNMSVQGRVVFLTTSSKQFLITKISAFLFLFNLKLRVSQQEIIHDYKYRIFYDV